VIHAAYQKVFAQHGQFSVLMAPFSWSIVG